MNFIESLPKLEIHIEGSGFHLNLPDDPNGVGIKVKDDNRHDPLWERRFHTGSPNDGKIDKVIEINLRDYVINTGLRIITVTATDGRENNSDLTGFLWSNEQKKAFPAFD